MRKTNSKSIKSLLVLSGIIVFIAIFFGLLQLASFVYLLRDIPGLLDLILLK